MADAETPVPQQASTPKERVAQVLQRCKPQIIDTWLSRVKQNEQLTGVTLTDHARTKYLPKLIDDLIKRLRLDSAHGKESDSAPSAAAAAHGKMRKSQGYSPAMLVHDSRILQVSLFGTLQDNLSVLDFSLLLPDIMTVADEVDSQLTQAMDSYMDTVPKPVAP